MLATNSLIHQTYCSIARVVAGGCIDFSVLRSNAVADHCEVTRSKLDKSDKEKKSLFANFMRKSLMDNVISCMAIGYT